MFEEPAFLQAAVKIGQWGAKEGHEEALLASVAGVLREDFGLKAAQVYLIDSLGQARVSRYSSEGSEPAVDVQIEGGSDLGSVLGSGQARVLPDVESLPKGMALADEVQSAVALPLKVDEEALGALVLGASEVDAFGDSVVERFGGLADLFALAIGSVRARDEIREQIAISVEGAKHNVPILSHAKSIGSADLEEGDEQVFDADELDLIESVTDQVAQAIDHISLLDGMQGAAVREQLINDITAQLQESQTVEGVLRVAAKAVRRALGNVEVSVWLSPEATPIVSDDDTGPLNRGDTVGVK